MTTAQKNKQFAKEYVKMGKWDERKKKRFLIGLEWPRGFQEVKVPRFHNNGTEWW
jgi:hypothetical protein